MYWLGTCSLAFFPAGCARLPAHFQAHFQNPAPMLDRAILAIILAIPATVLRQFCRQFYVSTLEI